ncbi:MAG: DegQ family serine endoprotease [bacterium]
MKQLSKKTPIIVLSLFLGIILGLIIASNFNWTQNGLAENEKNSPTAVLQQPPPAVGSDLESTSRAFVEIAKRITPTVVAITSETVVKVRNPFADFFNNDDFFRRFFRVPDSGGEQEFRQRGLGSGVIVSPKGYILTNYHVIKDADEVNVIIDRQEFDAEIIGTDPMTDIAVIKIDKDHLAYAQLGDSDKLEVGEWVLAIGSPFDLKLQHTVTSGIISAKGRSNLELSGELFYQDFIQTDAAINPGNSGGALVNIRGELIGINTAILPGNTGGNIGIGFAIPINMAKRVMDDLIAEGKVTRGYLGVRIGTPDAEMSEALKLEDVRGAIVNEVMKDTPADEAGLEVGDVVIEVNGKKVEDSQMLTNMIASFNPGETVKLKIVRDGRTKYLDVKLGERPGAEPAKPAMAKNQDTLDELGMELTDLTPQLAEQYGYENQRGVFVRRVKRGSVAAEKGMRPGDLIKEVNRQKVTSVRRLMKLIDEHDSDILLFQVQRGSRNFFVAMRKPKS